MQNVGGQQTPNQFSLEQAEQFMRAHVGATIGRNAPVPSDRPPIDEVGVAPIDDPNNWEHNVIQFVLDTLAGQRGMYLSDGKDYWLNIFDQEQPNGTLKTPQKFALNQWQENLAARCDAKAQRYGSYMTYTARDV